MSNEIKVTFVGGADLLGETLSADLAAPVIVGRTHRAGIRFTKKDGDVSGVHVEIRGESDGIFAVAVKEFVLNERDKVGCGEIRKLAKGDVLTLGPKSRAGIRIDALPIAGSAVSPAEAPTGETRFTSATGVTGATGMTGLTDVAPTGATQFASRATLPTNFAEPDAVPAEARTGDGETEVIDPEKLREAVMGVGAQAEDIDRPTEILDRTASGGITSDGVTSDGVTTGSGLDKTIALPQNAGATVMIDPKLLPKIDPDAPKRFRKRLMIFSIFGFAAMLGVVIYTRMNHSAPYLSHPKTVVSTSFKGPSGMAEIQIDFPWNSRASKTETPTSIEVMTLTGKDSDCPFHLDFSVRSDSRQLELSLEDSVESELATLGKKGYSFLASRTDESVSPEERAGYFFFEDQYPGSCQGLRSRGTRFFRREYVVSRGSEGWWGVVILFRDGDRVYRLLRDIPEYQKPRGQFLLLIDPNIALYAPFLDRHWESLGRSAVDKGEPPEGLFAKTRRLVDRGWAEDWTTVQQNVNLLMVRQYGKNDSFGRSVRQLYDDFCRSKDSMWGDFELERDIAIKNGDLKRLRFVGEKCRSAFGSDTRDWRFKRCNDSKEWPWEIKSR